MPPAPHAPTIILEALARLLKGHPPEIWGSLALPSSGEVSGCDTVCATCGKRISYGGEVHRYRPGESFNQHHQMYESPREGVYSVCRWCMVLLKGDFLNHFQKSCFNGGAVFTADGEILDISRRKPAALAGFLLDPPAPPFVAYIPGSASQQCAWRAPVTLDRDLIQIGLGMRRILIDRPFMLAAFEAVNRLRGTASSAEAPTIHLAAPFESAYEGSSGYGVLGVAWVEWAEGLGLTDEIHLLNSLGPGETWGLAALLRAEGKNEKMSVQIKQLPQKTIERRSKNENSNP